MTGHEIGPALPAAGLAAGYGDGFLTAGLIAAVLGVVATVAVPAVRPSGAARVGIH